MTARRFRVAMSPRCFRFKPDSLVSHAPHEPGVYEFVTFDAGKNPRVLFVGTALDKSVHECLSEHWGGRLTPTAQELFAVAPDIYFDYVDSADVSEVAEFKDIAGAFVAKHQPRFNAGPVPSSGKHASVEVEELD